MYFRVFSLRRKIKSEYGKFLSLLLTIPSLKSLNFVLAVIEYFDSFYNEI